MLAAIAAWLANPDNQAILISMLEAAVQGGRTLYTDLQLKEMNDILVALKANTAQLADDVKSMDADIDARDKALEQDLNK